MATTKLILVDDLARILGAKVTLEPPDILLYTVTEVGSLLSAGPYIRVDNLEDQLVQLVQQSTVFWESVAHMIDIIFRSTRVRARREIKLPPVPPQPVPRPEPLPRREPRALPPAQGDKTMEYFPPAGARDPEVVILKRY